MTANSGATSTDPRPEFAPRAANHRGTRASHYARGCRQHPELFIDRRTVRWKAASGFTVPVDYSQPVFRPLGSEIARRAFEAGTVGIIQGIGSRPEFAEKEFPVHLAERVSDMAVAPLRIVGSNSGALTAGYRSPTSLLMTRKSF
jgi:hypothetical protein